MSRSFSRYPEDDEFNPGEEEVDEEIFDPADPEELEHLDLSHEIEFEDGEDDMDIPFSLPDRVEINLEQLEKKQAALLKENEEINREANEDVKARAERLVQEIENEKKFTQKRISKRRTPQKRRKVVSSKNSRVQEDDEIDEVAKQMGVEARVKFYKARVKVLEKELSDCRKSNEGEVKKNKKLRLEIKDIKTGRNRHQKKVSTLEKLLSKARQDAKLSQQKMKVAQDKLIQAKSEMKMKIRSERERGEKISMRNKNPLESKVQRLGDECAKFRKQNIELRREMKEKVKKLNSDNERLIYEKRRLEKQKNDLLNAFKKQMKLIDILKRQKLHIQTAKLMSFTEEEFSKILDFNQR